MFTNYYLEYFFSIEHFYRGLVQGSCASKLKVDSYDRWKTFFDKRSATREERGSKENHLFRNSDDPHDVMISFDWDSKVNARKYMESEEIRKYSKERRCGKQ